MRQMLGKWEKMPITVKVSLAYMICSILQRCLSLITLPLFSRLLTTEEYGQVTVYSSWMSILSIFLTLNLAYGSFSTAMVKFENNREEYISSVQGIFLLLFGIFLVIYIPFYKLWNNLFELSTAFVIIMAMEIMCSNALFLWSGKNRFEFKYISVVTVTLLQSVLNPLLAYIFVINSLNKGYARILGGAIVGILFGGYFWVFNCLKGKKLYNKEFWKYALGFNIPLLAYYLSQVVFNQSDRIMISHMVGKDKAAVYGVAYTLATILTFVLNAINNSYVPWFYGKITEGKMEDNKPISFGIALLMMILLSGIIWFAPEIIGIMAGSKYEEAKYVVPPVAVSVFLLFISQLFINVEFFYEDKKSLVRASIGAAVVNLVLNWICINMFGYIAAAYTTLVSYLIFAISNYVTMKKLLKSKNQVDKAYDYKSLILLFLVFSLLTIVGAALYNALLPRIIISVTVVAFVAVKRKYFIIIIKKIKR